MPTAHPRFPEFYAAMANLALFIPWKGDVVRQAAPRYMSLPYRFTGVGSVKAGAAVQYKV